MRGRGIYIAAGFLILAVGIFYFTERKSPSSPNRTPSPVASPVFSLTASQVTAITVHYTGKVLTLTHKQAGWTYSDCASTDAPDSAACAAAPADDGKATLILGAVIGLRPESTVYGAPDGFPAYGLDSAANGEIDLSGTTGQPLVLWIGNKTPDGNSRYVRRPGSADVLVVSNSPVDSEILTYIDNPPKPSPTPSPAVSGAPAPSPS